jgi:SAM-dependent methyltransferase
MSSSPDINLINGYYTRPAMLALAGDVAGRRILDAGCGAGPLFAALRDRGALVTGIDKSAGMLALARRRLGDDANLQVAELGRPLPFPDGAFDDVTASLVLHYLEDWGPALAELRRVNRPGGRLIVSVDHPFVTNMMHREAGHEPDYFTTYNHIVEWTVGGQTARLCFWHRPLHAMTDAFTAAGFRILVISEPAPDTPASCSPTTSRATRASFASCSSSCRRDFILPLPVRPVAVIVGHLRRYEYGRVGFRVARPGRAVVPRAVGFASCLGLGRVLGWR